MRRAFVQTCAVLSAVMAAAVGTRGVAYLVSGGGDWLYAVTVVWCVCVIVTSISALGRRA